MDILALLRLLELKDILSYKDWTTLTDKLKLYHQYDSFDSAESLINAVYEGDYQQKNKLLYG